MTAAELRNYINQIHDFTAPLSERIAALKETPYPSVVADHLQAARNLEKVDALLQETTESLSDFDTKQTLMKCQRLANSALELIVREEEAREEHQKHVEKLNAMSDEEREQLRKSASAIAALDDIDHDPLPDLAPAQLRKLDEAKARQEEYENLHENEDTRADAVLRGEDVNYRTPNIPSQFKVLENLDWNEGEILETSRGWRILFEASVTQEFWDLWNEKKSAVKSAGFSCTKNFEKGWIAQFWQEATEAEVQKHKTAEETIAKHAAEVAAANEKYLEENPNIREAQEKAKREREEARETHNSLKRLVESLEWKKCSTKRYHATPELLQHQEALEAGGFKFNLEEAQWGRDNYVIVPDGWFPEEKPRYVGYSTKHAW